MSDRRAVVQATDDAVGDELWPNDPTDIRSFALHVDRFGRMVRVPLDPDLEWSVGRRHKVVASRLRYEDWGGTIH